MSQTVCVLTLFAKIKLSQKILNLQYITAAGVPDISVRVSNTTLPSGYSALWINATKAECFHVSPNGSDHAFFWPLLPSGSWNVHTHDPVDT